VIVAWDPTTRCSSTAARQMRGRSPYVDPGIAGHRQRSHGGRFGVLSFYQYDIVCTRLDSRSGGVFWPSCSRHCWPVIFRGRPEQATAPAAADSMRTCEPAQAGVTQTHGYCSCPRLHRPGEFIQAGFVTASRTAAAARPGLCGNESSAPDRSDHSGRIRHELVLHARARAGRSI